ncbi:hypothetical protein [Novosphingobium panipatense]|uniref:hypothetical protein n=1 Tax=Novosphingobium panipatense TaxID=428991 RepID=UPI0036178D69
MSHGVYFALGMLCAQLGTGTLAHRHGLLALVCAGAAAVQVRTTAGWEMGSRAELSAQWLVPYAVWFILAAAVGASFRWRSAIELRVARHAKGLRMAGMTTYPFTSRISIRAVQPSLRSQLLASWPHRFWRALFRCWSRGASLSNWNRTSM